jgi:hypothetical protein
VVITYQVNMKDQDLARSRPIVGAESLPAFPKQQMLVLGKLFSRLHGGWQSWRLQQAGKGLLKVFMAHIFQRYAG